MKQSLQAFLILTAAGVMGWAQPVQEFFDPPQVPIATQPRAAAGRGTAIGGIVGARQLLAADMPVGRWWDNPALADRIGLTEEQKRKMDDVFQASRIKLIDLRASLEKEEAMLDPLMEAATPDDSKLLPQIDRVAQARAELEKADARLLLGLRHVLSPQQWQTLQTESWVRARGTTAPRPARSGNPPLPPSAYPPAKRGPGDPLNAPATPPPAGGRGNDQ